MSIALTRLFTICLVFLSAKSVIAQPVFRGTEILPPEEFAARRAKVIDQIGDGVAIVLGTTEPPGEVPFRQNSQFFYLTGLAEPRANLIMDGRTKKTTVFLQEKTPTQEKSREGPGIGPGADTATLLGVDAATPRSEFTAAISAIAPAHRTIYTPFAAEVLSSQSQGDPTRMWSANKEDLWDGRDSREAAFIAKLRLAAPQSEINNLDPIVNGLRAVKSPREIALIREATRFAGLGIMEAMRDARPGMREYELQADAECVFKRNGAYGASYFALIATGENTYYTHYNRDTAVLADGDLVQFDYAPDYKYYQSDVTRVFPANGVFTERQRGAYQIYLQLYRTVMTSIQVHLTPAEVISAALPKMDAILASYKFTDPKIERAAKAFVENYRRQSSNARALGHSVGLEVHDPGVVAGSPLEPGRVFTIEPEMRIEEDHTGIRLENTILMTETGYENLSEFVPIEIKDIEKLMTRKGLSDAALKLK